MWTRNVVWAVVAVALLGGCGSEDEGSENPGGTGGGGAGGASGAAGTAGTGGTAGGGTGGTGGVTGGTGGMGGAGGFMIPECPMEPGPAMCGTNACTAIEPTALCIKTCCTADNMCGTNNTISPTCMVAPVNNSMCPDETVGGTPVAGCCVDEMTNECGINNILGVGPTCVGRTSPLLAAFMANLTPLNCDGTPVTGGAGGMGGMGGMGGEGGMGGGDPDAGM